MELVKLSAYQMAQGLKNKEFSSKELTNAHLEQINATNTAIHSFLTVTPEVALETANKVDSLISKNEKIPALAGIPVAVKDNISTKDIPTTAGSKILENYVPVYNATVVDKINSSMLPILGKTNLDEFAMGSSTEHSAYGKTNNPIDLNRTPGGSGGGSSASVASFQTPLALGSDTGGSIRQPAAVTGTVGLKPTYGGISRYGLIALASSLDQIGPATRTVLDNAMLSEVLYGYDAKDSTSLKDLNQSFVQSALSGESGDVKGKKIGIVKELSGDGYQKEIKENFNNNIKLLEQQGAEIVEISCPNFKYALAAYYLILPAEASSNLARFDSIRFGLRVQKNNNENSEQVMKQTRGQGFGAEVKRRIMLGTYALSAGYYDAYYGSAQKVRTLIKQDFANAFSKVDVLMSPTTPETAFEFGSKISNPLAMYLNDIATIPVNLAGNCAISVPCGLDTNGLPMGLQIIAPEFKDSKLFYYASAFEKILDQELGSKIIDKIKLAI